MASALGLHIAQRGEHQFIVRQVEHEFQPADVAPIQDARTRGCFVLQVLNGE